MIHSKKEHLRTEPSNIPSKICIGRKRPEQLNDLSTANGRHQWTFHSGHEMNMMYVMDLVYL